jgi:predicted ribosomally synthesized peptide with SipW-like signal peptide
MKKIGLLFVALVLALGSLGVAYAAWTDEVTVVGSVETGSLCWIFTDQAWWDSQQPVNPGGDFPTANPDYGCNPGFVPNEAGKRFWPLDKNVAWGACEISEDGKTLSVEINNAYPCYFNSFSFYVRNCGTVPLKIDHVVLNGEEVLLEEFYAAFDVNDDGLNDFEIQYGDNFGAQIEPGDSMLEFSMWLHPLQPAPQDSTLRFTMSLVAVQWNEYPLPPEER